MGIRHAYATSARLLPIKFVLLLFQILFLVWLMLERDNHIYFEVGQAYSTGSDKYTSAESTLLGVAGTMIGMCCMEFVFMLLGTSVVPIFAKFNLL